METSDEIRERWIYLRDLLIEQLARFEDGAMQMHEAGVNVSPEAIFTIEKNILDFDTMIARSEKREV